MNQGEQELIQWHPAFRGAVKTELEAEKGLRYLDEHALTKKELKVDLIVLDQKERPIENAIGHLFRKYNIMEYKSPTDYFSLDDYYKVMAYAYLYKSATNHIDDIKIEEITVSFVCDRYPEKMIQHIQDTWNCSIQQYQSGIYYIKDRLPLQLIVTSQLKAKEHKWLKSLTNHITTEELKLVLTDYSIDQKNENKDVIIDAIVKANKGELRLIKEGDPMSKELLKLMEPEINQIKEAYAKEKLKQQEEQLLKQQQQKEEQLLKQQQQKEEQLLKQQQQKEEQLLKQQKEQLLKQQQQQQQQQKQFIVRMAKQGIDVMKIVDITGMTEEEIKEILNEPS